MKWIQLGVKDGTLNISATNFGEVSAQFTGLVSHFDETITLVLELIIHAGLNVSST